MNTQKTSRKGAGAPHAVERKQWSIRMILNWFAVFSVLTAWLPAAQAEEPFYGFGGRLESGLSLTTSDSRVLVLSNEIDEIENREGKGNQHWMTSLLVLGDIFYAFSEDFQVYARTPFFDDPREGVSTGMVKYFNDGSLIDLYVFGNSIEVWRNPYAIGRERSKTNMVTLGFAADYKDIGGTGFNTYLKLKTVDVDEDLIGEMEPDLERDSLAGTLGLGYRFTIDSVNTLTPGVWYSRDFAEGAANRSHQYAGGIEYTRETRRYRLNIITHATNRHHDRTHPVFGKTRNDWEYFSLLSLIWFDLFNNEHLYADLGISYSALDSNIDFYNESNATLALAVGYFFY